MDASSIPGTQEPKRGLGPKSPLRLLGVVVCVVLLVGVAVLVRPGSKPQGVASESSLEPHAILHTSQGDVTIALYEQLVPLAVGRFVDLALAGYYNGTAVDRVVKGYDVQMGDPASGGHPLPDPIPDEFHPALRHEGPGVVSMSTTQPDGGTGSFFITTATIHSYDDRYSVFGHVVSGLDVVRAIEAVPIQGTTFGPPLQPITLLGVDVQAATPAAGAVRHGVAVTTLSDDKTASVETGATFAVIATNTGTVRDILALDASAPVGWTATFENPRVSLPAGRSWVVLLTLTPSEGAVPADVAIHVRSESEQAKTAETTVHVTRGPFGSQPQPGTAVTVEYTGVLPDGRLFDTTDEALATSPDHVRMVPEFSRQTFQPYEFTLGQGQVVAGFEALVGGTHLGEESVGRVPWQLGYTSTSDVLAHRDLVFEVRLVSAVPR